MLKRLVAVSSVLLAASTPMLVQAQQIGRWEMLGSREVAMNRDRDSIHVGRGDGGFTKIKLNVRGNAIRVESLTVVYANGAPDNIPLRSLLTPGTDSRVIDLRGGRRAIRRVDMVLRSVPNGRGKARVELWGRH